MRFDRLAGGDQHYTNWSTGTPDLIGDDRFVLWFQVFDKVYYLYGKGHGHIRKFIFFHNHCLRSINNYTPFSLNSQWCRRYAADDVSANAEMMLLTPFAMMRCLPLMPRRAHHCRRQHHTRRVHHLPDRANIIQKSLFCHTTKETFCGSGRRIWTADTSGMNRML